MKILFGDFESRSKIDIKKAGADVYARDASTRVMAFGHAFDDEEVRVSRMGYFPDLEVIDHVANEGVFVAHNAPFEYVIWNYCWRKEFPDLPELKAETLVCTMAMAYSMALPGSLENAAPAAGIDFRKDAQGKRIMLKLSQPNSDGNFYEPEDLPEQFEQLYAYCGVDVEVERGLFKRLVKLSPKEKEVWLLDHKINQRGVAIDLKAVKAAIELVEYEQKRLDKEMQTITHGWVSTCSATKQLTDYLRNLGMTIDGVAKNDVIDALKIEDMPENIKKILELRQEAAKSSTAKLNSMVKGVCDDGRTRGLFQYHGAGTGRWAGRRIQLQNLPRPKIDQAAIDNVIELLRNTDCG